MRDGIRTPKNPHEYKKKPPIGLISGLFVWRAWRDSNQSEMSEKFDEYWIVQKS